MSYILGLLWGLSVRSCHSLICLIDESKESIQKSRLLHREITDGRWSRFRCFSFMNMEQLSAATSLLVFLCLIFPCQGAEKVKHRGLRQKDVEYGDKVRFYFFHCLARSGEESSLTLKQRCFKIQQRLK